MESMVNELLEYLNDLFASAWDAGSIPQCLTVPVPKREICKWRGITLLNIRCLLKISSNTCKQL